MEVLRAFDDYEQPPTAEETPAHLTDPEWVRVIGGNQAVVKSPGWGSKGNW